MSSLVELTILEISGLQEVLGGFIMETITLSNQGATVPDLGMPVSFWTSVCVLKIYIRCGWIWTLCHCGLKLCMLLLFCMDICLGGVLRKIYVAGDA